MKRTRIFPPLTDFPSQFWDFVRDTPIYDSSCSAQARVYYLDRDEGLYLKTAPKGTLSQEAAMTRFFHEKGLAAQVLTYLQADADWLLTTRVPGEDCIHENYLADPKRLCETTAALLRMLHDTPAEGCPIDRTADYLRTARLCFENATYEQDLFPDNWGYRTPEEAWAVVQSFTPELKSDTLIHGDYCLPNIMLDNWTFSGFIDLGSSGLGDKHIDLFWGTWTLQFNLHTDRWCDHFLDAYGRENFNPDILKAIAAFEVFG